MSKAPWVPCRCACCGSTIAGDREWSWCQACSDAGCTALHRGDGDVARGQRCPLVLVEAAPQVSSGCPGDPTDPT